MMSHWMVLKRCAARALLLARHKESQAGDAAHVFEDNGFLTQETIVTSNEWKKSLFRTLCASTRIWPSHTGFQRFSTDWMTLRRKGVLAP
jgi:hypothetical protein